jgi:hypothetical protein
MKDFIDVSDKKSGISPHLNWVILGMLTMAGILVVIAILGG